MQSAINWFPALAAVIGAKRAGSGYCDGNSIRITLVEKNCVQAHAARAWLPFRTGIAAAQSREFMPRFPTVLRFEQRGIFNACVNMIGIVERRLDVPHALEFPQMLCAVVPLMRREWFPGFRRRVVNELVAFRFGHAVRTFQFFRTAAGCVPGFAAVIRALNDLPKPTAGLRGVDSVGINR